MVDDIDIGIGIHTGDADVAAAERASAAVAKFTLTVEQSREIMNRVGGDFGKFKAEVLKLKEAYDLAASKSSAVVASTAQIGNAAKANVAPIRQAAQSLEQHEIGVERSRGAARGFALELSHLSFALLTSEGSALGVVRAMGLASTEFAELSGSAALAAKASGIGAMVTALVTVIALLDHTSEATKKQDESLKSFIQTNEAFAARAKAVSDVVKTLGGVPKSTAAQVQLVGITKELDEMGAALTKAQKQLSDAFERPKTPPGSSGFGQLGSVLDQSAAKTIALSLKIQALDKQFASNAITLEQYTAALRELEKANPEKATLFADVASKAADFSALTEAIRKLTDQTLQLRAVELSERLTFGSALGKELAFANERLNALRAGGPIALDSFNKEQKAVEKAESDWKEYTATKEGSRFASIAFRDALLKEGTEVQAAARTHLATARQVVQADTTTEDIPKRLAATRAANAELAVAEAERLHGEVAAQRETIAQELKAKVQSIRDDATLEGVRGDLIANERRIALDKIAKVNKEQERNVAALFVDSSARAAELVTPATNEVQKAVDEANKKRREQQKQVDAISLQDAEETANAQVELAVTFDAERDATILKARRDASEALKKIATDEEADILQKTGQGAEARRRIIQQEFETRAKAIQAQTPPGALNAAQQAQVNRANEANQRQRDIDTARAGFDQLQTQGSDALKQLDSDLQRTQALAVSGAISERQAREQVIAAYVRSRDAITAILPQLDDVEAAAKATGDVETVRGIEQLRTKYLELGNTLNQLQDTFARLKTTARESVTSAFENLLVDATKLGAQDTSQINALSDQLRSAKAELDDLLSTPSGKRTSEQNQRITALRGEIEQTTVSLDSAKQSITTWRDLFINAAQSVVDALIKVSAQMLAVRIISIATGLFSGGGGGGSSLGPRPAGGGATGGFGFDFGFAEGGAIGGRSGRDANWARVTKGEFVQPEPTVTFYGAEFQEAQRRRLFRQTDIQTLMSSTLRGMRSMNLRPRVGTVRFAEGGLQSAEDIGFRGSTGQAFTHTIVVKGLPQGAYVEHLDSPAGHRVVVKIVTDNANAVNAGLGRR